MRNSSWSGFSWLALVAVLLTGPSVVRGQGYEAIVNTKPKEISLPAGASSAPLTAAAIASADLRALFDSCEAVTITPAYPSWQPADTVRVNLSGYPQRIRDRGDVWVVAFPDADRLARFLTEARQRSAVLVAGPLPRPKFCSLYPNDSTFAAGRQWGLHNSGVSIDGTTGTAGADVDAVGAWGLETGQSSIWIGIIDNGVTGLHPDLEGRFAEPYSSPTYDDASGNAGHGFLVAGVAAATGNNLIGIAGMDWTARIDSKYIGPTLGKDHGLIGDAITAAAFDRVNVMNHSYLVTSLETGDPVDDPNIASDLAEAYTKFNVVNVAAMGNGGTGVAQYPAAYQFLQMLAVGAVDNTGTWWNQSNTGSWIDVVAPGTQVWSTYPRDSMYMRVDGTSVAAPAVSGLVSLMASKWLRLHPTGDRLYSDDYEHLIKLSATAPPPGYPDRYGKGMINARRALEYLSAPHVLLRGRTGVGQFGESTGTVYFKPFGLTGSGLTDGSVYGAKRYEIRFPVSFGSAFTTTPEVWGCGFSGDGVQVGYRPDDAPSYNYGAGFCEPAGAVNQNGCTMHTYVYWVYNPATYHYLWLPAPPGEVRARWSAFQARSLPTPSASQSYYVPQAIEGTTVVDGSQAYQYFHACPNNEGGTSLPNNARIKVVVKDANDDPIQGISPADVYVLLNGGTLAQRFASNGADSVIANLRWNSLRNCPDVRVLTADRQTDEWGETEITFTGSGGTRSSTRKWGHYDSKLPVYVFNTEIQGKLSSAPGSPDYVLRIKNFDVSGGLAATIDQGEVVSTLDYNTMVGNLNKSNIITYWLDYNESGTVTTVDYNMFVAHLNHRCDLPSNP
jgi:hypothetical protein